MYRIDRHRGALLGAVLLGAAIAFPLGVIASHRFTDVPTTNTYHADIDALADAGVTTGCGNGTTFCPSAFVTREQMAAFMNRLGALAAGKTPVVNATRLDGLDSTDFVRTGTDHFNCLGRDMFPVRNPMGNLYWHAGADEFTRLGSDSALAEFACPVHIPDGALVTAFRVGAYDGSSGGYVTCVLYRALALSAGPYGLLAAVATELESTPDEVTLQDITIEHATIDNSAYGYEAVCSVRAPSLSLLTEKVLGISVEYTTQ